MTSHYKNKNYSYLIQLLYIVLYIVTINVSIKWNKYLYSNLDSYFINSYYICLFLFFLILSKFPLRLGFLKNIQNKHIFKGVGTLSFKEPIFCFPLIYWCFLDFSPLNKVLKFKGRISTYNNRIKNTAEKKGGEKNEKSSWVHKKY